MLSGNFCCNAFTSSLSNLLQTETMMKNTYEGEIWASMAQMMKRFGFFIAKDSKPFTFLVPVPVYTNVQAGMVLKRRGRAMIHEYVEEAVKHIVEITPRVPLATVSTKESVPWKYKVLAGAGPAAGVYLRTQLG